MCWADTQTPRKVSPARARVMPALARCVRAAPGMRQVVARPLSACARSRSIDTMASIFPHGNIGGLESAPGRREILLFQCVKRAVGLEVGDHLVDHRLGLRSLGVDARRLHGSLVLADDFELSLGSGDLAEHYRELGH